MTTKELIAKSKLLTKLLNLGVIKIYGWGDCGIPDKEYTGFFVFLFDCEDGRIGIRGPNYDELDDYPDFIYITDAERAEAAFKDLWHSS